MKPVCKQDINKIHLKSHYETVSTTPTYYEGRILISQYFLIRIALYAYYEIYYDIIYF